jgi:hypothetical protein
MADGIKKILITMLKEREILLEMMLTDNITVQEMLRRTRSELVDIER